MQETEQAERLLEILTAWGERTPQVRALWLTGSFAAGTADRFSDIDLRGCIESEAFEWFASVEDSLLDIPDLFVLKRRGFSQEHQDSELVVDFHGGLCLDFHIVGRDRLDSAYFNQYPIRVLFDEGGDLAELHASAQRKGESSGATDEKIRISRAVMAWSFLEHAVVAAVRGKHSYALSLLEGERVALAHVLLGRTEPIPSPFSPTFLPKFQSFEERKILDGALPPAVIPQIPTMMKLSALALKDSSADLEKADTSGRLARMRSSVEYLIQREFSEPCTEGQESQ